MNLKARNKSINKTIVDALESIQDHGKIKSVTCPNGRELSPVEIRHVISKQRPGMFRTILSPDGDLLIWRK